METYLVVGVVEVHALAKGHLSFGLQLGQKDRSGELQDPRRRRQGQEVIGSGGHRVRRS